MPKKGGLLTTAEIQDLVRQDWTIAPGIGSNSNQRFQDLVQEVARLIQSGFRGLDRVMVERDAALIMAQLAHIHHLFPIDQFEVDEDGTVRGKIYWQNQYIEFEARVPESETNIDEVALLEELRDKLSSTYETVEHRMIVKNNTFAECIILIDGKRFSFANPKNAQAATKLLDKKVRF